MKLDVDVVFKGLLEGGAEHEGAGPPEGPVHVERIRVVKVK